MSEEYPPCAFYFMVGFGAASGKGNTSSDSSFQEVSGIGPEIQTEDVIEGGVNTYVHQLPKSVKHPKLVLKRGIASNDSELVGWCKEVLEKFSIPIKTKEVYVQLLNEKGDPIREWSFCNAYPVSWEIESFESTKNNVAIEKIELSYNYSQKDKEKKNNDDRD